MKNSLVSVVIPTYNRAHCVMNAIESVLAQSHREIEVVVVDDGSGDNTPEVIAQRYGTNPRVKYYRKENGGVAAARNLGLSVATGEFLALLDSDDLWMPWKLELQLAGMDEHPEIGMVWSDMVAVDPHGNVIAPAFLRKMYHAWRHFSNDTLFGKGMPIGELAKKHGGMLQAQVENGAIAGDAQFYSGKIFPQMLLGSLVHTSTVLLRRERLERVKCFNLEFTPIGEDYDFHLRTCHEGAVGFFDLPTMLYQTGNPDQLTRSELKPIVAENCLRTIMPFIKAGEAGALSAATINRRISDVHDWAADALLQNGDVSGCLRHSMASVRYFPWRLRRWKILLASCLPAPVVRALRHSGARN